MRQKVGSDIVDDDEKCFGCLGDARMMAERDRKTARGGEIQIRRDVCSSNEIYSSARFFD